MVLDGSSHFPLKRRRFTTIDSMEVEAAKAMFEAAKEKYGRDLRVFETFSLSSSPSQVVNDEETDDFYEFTAEDYHRLLAAKEDKYMKTRKMREAEEAARRSKFTKAKIRVRFPDNHTLEAAFHPSENVQSLFDLVTKVVAQSDLPFYLYTAPPKMPIKDLSQDFYAAGFVPGAIVYFSYILPQGDDAASHSSGPFLREDVMALKNLEAIFAAEEPVQTAPEAASVSAAPSPVAQEPKPAGKKPIKPKWLKL